MANDREKEDLARQPADERKILLGAMITRRSLLELAGLTVASSAFPRMLVMGQSAPEGAKAAAEGATHAADAISPTMARLSAYMSEAGGRALPDEVVEKTKQHILDTFAAIISGSELPPGNAALSFAKAYGGKEVSTVVASNILCGPIEAAMVNGVLAHSDETDDSNGPSHSHPGCAVVPAALAAGEQFGIGGARERHHGSQCDTAKHRFGAAGLSDSNDRRSDYLR